MEHACREIIECLINKPDVNPKELDRIKRLVGSRYQLKRMPSNSDILKFASIQERKILHNVLRKKPIRTLSGVTVVAVMSAPEKCPHGRCLYCPGGPETGSPQSYTGKEPAALRGAQHNFDPYDQVRARIRQLEEIGHKVDKVEFIIMGGTFPARDVEYQKEFLKGCLEGLIGYHVKSLEEAKTLAEHAKIRNVGITFETRPDYCKESHVDLILSLGGTRVELGVQNVFDDIYELVRRGHTVRDVIEATRILKDSGLKVCYHMMPGLPGSNFERDLEGFSKIFNEENFRPDMLKIYPCLVIEGTELYELWKKGLYKPYTVDEMVELLVNVLEKTPEWVRIQRIQRDIPAYLIQDGVKKSNLRELVWNELEKRGIKCREIRYREVGHIYRRKGILPSPEDITLKKTLYKSSSGVDLFISFEDTVRDILIGFLRLRFPSEKAHRKELNDGRTLIIRELHVYGPLVPVGEKPTFEWQHKGYGRKLVKEAERIALEEFDARKILVTSGIGVRDYYRKLGYKQLGPYMGKYLC